MKYIIGVKPTKIAALDKIRELGVPSAQAGETIIMFDTGAAFVLAASMLRRERIEFTAKSVPYSGTA